jgi:hypothetical protein
MGDSAQYEPVHLNEIDAIKRQSVDLNVSDGDINTTLCEEVVDIPPQILAVDVNVNEEAGDQNDNSSDNAKTEKKPDPVNHESEVTNDVPVTDSDVKDKEDGVAEQNHVSTIEGIDMIELEENVDHSDKSSSSSSSKSSSSTSLDYCCPCCGTAPCCCVCPCCRCLPSKCLQPLTRRLNTAAGCLLRWDLYSFTICLLKAGMILSLNQYHFPFLLIDAR